MNSKIVFTCILLAGLVQTQAKESVAFQKMEQCIRNYDAKCADDVQQSYSQANPDQELNNMRLKGYAAYIHYNPDSVIHYLRPAFQKGDRKEETVLRLAEAFLWKKDFKTAGTVLKEVPDTKSAGYYRIQATQMEVVNRFEDALQYWNQAIAADPSLYEPRERRARLLSWMKQFDKAIKAMNTIISDSQAPPNLVTRVRIQKAEVYAWKKDLQRALELLNEILQDHPQNTDALMLKGQVLEWKGEFKKAKESYSDVLRSDADNKKARLKMEKLLWVK